MSPLLAVPNVSEGRDPAVIEALARALTPDVARNVRLLDVHSDADHNRTVFTLTGPPRELAHAVTSLARAAIAMIDLRHHLGVHPRVGALDVAPIVYTSEADRGAACAEALVLADRLGEEVRLPVFLYGALSEHGHTRAQLRRGGPARLAARIAGSDSSAPSTPLRPDFGPPHLHETAGAVLVAARPPLVAFNIELEPPATLDTAREIAARIRESGPDGLPGIRAIGVALETRGRVQISTNIEDHHRADAADVIAAIAQYATPARAELVGLAPAAALARFPPDLELVNRRTIEDALSD